MDFVPLSFFYKYIIRGATSNFIDVGNAYEAKSDSSELPLPSEKEISAREEYLLEKYPLLQKIKETVKTLDALEVEDIKPGKLSNPSNVQRVEFILPEENYNEIFPKRHFSYSYKRLLQVRDMLNK